MTRPAPPPASSPAACPSLWRRGGKRAADAVLAALALALGWPLLLVCWLAVRCSDGAPALYAQERVGRGGRTFRMYKFRTMRPGAEPHGPQLCAGPTDQRLTPIGHWLRSRHLDELPQLWNVLRGDMAIVGPRPERPYFAQRIAQADARYARLAQLRPGLTSPATLVNGYTDTMEKMLRRLELDLDYLDHYTAAADARIVWATLCQLLARHDPAAQR